MNTASQERVTHIYAKKNYSVISTVSKHIYVSDKSANKFMPLFGRSPGNFHFKRLETQAFLADEYILVMDALKSVYHLDINEKSLASNQSM
jgi:hypothetical protein